MVSTSRLSTEEERARRRFLALRSFSIPEYDRTRIGPCPCNRHSGLDGIHDGSLSFRLLAPLSGSIVPSNNLLGLLLRNTQQVSNIHSTLIDTLHAP